MSLLITDYSAMQTSPVENYISWLGISHDVKAVTTIRKLLANIQPHVFLDNGSFKIKRVENRNEGSYVDAIIRLSYSRYTEGTFPVELSRRVLDIKDSKEKSYMVYNQKEFPVATIMSKNFLPDDPVYFINTLFSIQEPWYFQQKKLHEISRWAAHPVYDIYHFHDIKLKAMKEALRFTFEKSQQEKTPTVAIFSERVVRFLRGNNVAVIRKLQAKEKDSPARNALKLNYPLYWRDGNPGVYEIVTIL